MSMKLKCGFCDRAFGAKEPRAALRHCHNPECNWCVDCVLAKQKAAKGK
jgi:hypothetical protein